MTEQSPPSPVSQWIAYSAIGFSIVAGIAVLMNFALLTVRPNALSYSVHRVTGHVVTSSYKGQPQVIVVTEAGEQYPLACLPGTFMNECLKPAKLNGLAAGAQVDAVYIRAEMAPALENVALSITSENTVYLNCYQRLADLGLIARGNIQLETFGTNCNHLKSEDL